MVPVAVRSAGYTSYFGQILDSDGTVLLCLHEWGAHEHPSLMTPHHGMPGNGLLLFFRVDDFELALQRARSLVSLLEEEPHVNPNTQPRSSRFGIRTDITSRSVRSVRPDKVAHLTGGGPELHGQSRPNLAPLAGRLLPSDRPIL
jgi:hypothetical protein